MRQADELDAGIRQEISERCGVLRVSIENQILLSSQKSVDGIGDVSADLHHPDFVRAGYDPGDLDSACLQLDHEEDVERDEPTQAPDLDGEEVGGSEHVPMGS